MADFAHTPDAARNRQEKAKALYWQMVLAGLLEVPTEAKVRLYLRKGAGLDRAPSEETWALAGELLAAWPPVIMPEGEYGEGDRGPCGCYVDPDSRVLFESLPRDRVATGYRFTGWPCPHNSPAYLGCRPPDRFPAVSQNDRVEVAAGVATIRATQARDDILGGIPLSAAAESAPPSSVEKPDPHPVVGLGQSERPEAEDLDSVARVRARAGHPEPVRTEQDEDWWA